MLPDTMNNQIEQKLNNIMQIVEQAIFESEIAVSDSKKGYAYAAGYSRSALRNIMDEIESMRYFLNK